MNPTILLLVCSTLFLVPVLWWIFKNNHLNLEEIQRHAESRGWSYAFRTEDNCEIVSLSPVNQEWTLELTRRLSRSSAHGATKGGNSAVWISKKVMIEEGLLAVRAGPPLPQAATGLGNSFVQTLLKRAMIEMCGGDPGEIRELYMVSVGEPVFDATHTVVVTHPDLGKRWVSAEVQKILQDWPKGLAVPDLVLSKNGIRFGITGTFSRMGDHLDALVSTGQQVSQHLN